MKTLPIRYYLLILLFAHSWVSYAQPAREFLFSDDRPVSISGFGGVLLELSSLEGELVPSGGFSLAALFDQTFFAGFYGMGTFKRLDKSFPELQQVDMAFGHGGLWLGYLNQSHRLIHPSVSLKVGGGGVYLAERERNEFIFEEENRIDEDALFVLTPQAEVELNVAPWMKIKAGVGYRFVSDVDTPYLSHSDFTSMVGNLSLYFGWFNSGYSYQ